MSQVKHNQIFHPYFEPEPVCTTLPLAISPFLISDVVIASPSSKAEDPEIKPDIEPSRFSRHLETVGTPLGATLALEAGLVDANFAFSFFWPKPKREIVAPEVAALTLCSALEALVAASRFALASAAVTRFTSATSARFAA